MARSPGECQVVVANAALTEDEEAAVETEGAVRVPRLAEEGGWRGVDPEDQLRHGARLSDRKFIDHMRLPRLLNRNHGAVRSPAPIVGVIV
jgi:hypothetical protein